MIQSKYRESLCQLTNKVGGIGKEWKAVHKEQKPCSKHRFCFLWKIEFEDYFGHIFSSSHKNSIHLQKKAYDEIDSLWDELFVEFTESYLTHKSVGIKETTADNKEDSELFKMSPLRSGESFNKLQEKINDESSQEVEEEVVEDEWEEINVWKLKAFFVQTSIHFYICSNLALVLRS